MSEEVKEKKEKKVLDKREQTIGSAGAGAFFVIVGVIITLVVIWFLVGCGPIQNPAAPDDVEVIETTTVTITGADKVEVEVPERKKEQEE